MRRYALNPATEPERHQSSHLRRAALPRTTTEQSHACHRHRIRASRTDRPEYYRHLCTILFAPAAAAARFGIAVRVGNADAGTHRQGRQGYRPALPNSRPGGHRNDLIPHAHRQSSGQSAHACQPAFDQGYITTPGSSRHRDRQRRTRRSSRRFLAANRRSALIMDRPRQASRPGDFPPVGARDK